MKIKLRFLTKLTKSEPTTDINKQNITKNRSESWGQDFLGTSRLESQPWYEKEERGVEEKTGMHFGILLCLQDMETGIILTCGDVSGLLGKEL